MGLQLVNELECDSPSPAFVAGGRSSTQMPVLPLGPQSNPAGLIIQHYRGGNCGLERSHLPTVQTTFDGTPWSLMATMQARHVLPFGGLPLL